MAQDRFKAQRGFLTFAQNNSDTDYLTLAYALALSIKATQKITDFAVIVDEATEKRITDAHRKVFDHIILLTQDDAAQDHWKMRNEWTAWWLTPFKETIKIEADMLVPTSIDHWWDGLQQTEVCMTTNIRDYEGNVSNTRQYRKLFDSNNLPDVYSGLMYFRYGLDSKEFFTTAHDVFENWNMFKKYVLRNCRDEEPTTDVVFAIAASIVGVEKCTNPCLTFPTFVHMKPAVQGWPENVNWNNALYTEQDKTFITDKVISHYESL
jgi:hypothetical protein